MMNRKQYLELLEKELAFLPSDEHKDFILEFDSHIDEALQRQPDLAEDDLIERLPHPSVLAAEFRAEAAGTSSAKQSTSGRGQHHHTKDGQTESSERFNRFGRFIRSATRDRCELTGRFDDILHVEIQGQSAQLEFQSGKECVYQLEGYWDDYNIPDIHQTTNSLRIILKKDVEKLTMTLPHGLQDLQISTASGDLVADLPEGCAVKVNSASGDIRLQLNGGSVAVYSASGDVEINGRPADTEVKTASGDVELLGLVALTDVATASGDIRATYHAITADGQFSSVSGDIRLSLPVGSQPTVSATTMSGDIELADGLVKSRSPNTRAYRDGGPQRIEINTLSGDISVNP